MDRFSTRLAASLIEDRHREAAEARRAFGGRPMDPEAPAAAGRTGAAVFERALGALLRPLRFRTGTR